MNIDKSKYPLIKAELDNDPLDIGYSSMTQKQKISALLDRPLVDNPESPSQVLKPIDRNSVFSKISVTSLRKIPDSTIYSIGEMIDARDRERLLLWCSIAYAKELISLEEKNTLYSELTTIIDDPNYKDKVPGRNRMEVILDVNEPVNFSLDELEEVENG